MIINKLKQNMYKVEILPIAKKDIDNIIYYISHNLKNVTASKKLRDLFISSLDNILEFPYGCSIYKTLGILKNEYRCYIVKNYIMFYVIDEDKKIITIVRILNRKMNFNNILN